MSSSLNKKKTSNKKSSIKNTSKAQRILSIVLVLVMIGSMLVGSFVGLVM